MNSHSYYYQGHIVNPITWSLTSLATFFVSIRVLSRAKLSKGKPGIDDAFIFVATAVVIACNISATITISHFFAKAIKLENIHQVSIELITMNAIMVWTFALPKLAILALLQRIFMIPKSVLFAFWTLCVITIGGTLATTVVWAVQCKPARGNAHRVATMEHCSNKSLIQGLLWFTGALSACGDLIFSVYPQFLIAKLNMGLRKKLGYGLALGMGIIAFAASVYKLSLYPMGFFVPKQIYDSDTAQNYDIKIVFWALVESNVLIMSACLPTLGPFARFAIEKSNSDGFSKKRQETGKTCQIPDGNTVGSLLLQQNGSSPVRDTGDSLRSLEEELKCQSRQFRDSMRASDRLMTELAPTPPESAMAGEGRGTILKRVELQQWRESCEHHHRAPSRTETLGLSL